MTDDQSADPRAMLAEWANAHDEWTRLIVQKVLETGHPLEQHAVSAVYQLFLEEKGFVDRIAPEVPPLTSGVRTGEVEAVLKLKSLSAVQGVNALVSTPEIEFHDGLTIFFGENGSGKTGYSRILKSLANSRTADEILADINDASAPKTPSATVAFELGDVSDEKTWLGERGVPPFTRMSIFDTPAVNIHVDDDITYVFTPASLALFNHVTQGIRGVQKLLNEEIKSLGGSPTFLARFERGTSVYPLIETLGAASDLDAMRKLVDELDADPAAVEKQLQMVVASLQSNTVGERFKTQQRNLRAFDECLAIVKVLEAFPVDRFNATVATLGGLQTDYAAFRETLFAAADLPTPPEEHWEAFIRAGNAYREHLASVGRHDEARCLYCRQPLDADARSLVMKYREYLDDKIANDISTAEKSLSDITAPVTECTTTEAESFLGEYGEDESDQHLTTLRSSLQLHSELLVHVTGHKSIDADRLQSVPELLANATKYREATVKAIAELQKQVADGASALVEKTKELAELKARIELQKSLPDVALHVASQQRSHKLDTLAKKFKPLLASLTELSTKASDLLINANFEQLFAEECKILRAPDLELAFVGRDATTKRKKVLSGNHKPSKILSEGEQKVIAIADFLAEARLTGICAPVVFDDPVNSLDHVRLNEVADRITSLAETGQVVVFTHDILLATGLLARFEKSKRCTYYQVTSEQGPGAVTRASGPRWDSLSKLKAHVNDSISASKKETGEVQAALIRQGYGWLRSWCEVFVETELLAGVTERYQPNVKMTALAKINAERLPDAIEAIDQVFSDACRYIESHSQPLVTLDVVPTLTSLEADWKRATEARNAYLKA